VQRQYVEHLVCTAHCTQRDRDSGQEHEWHLTGRDEAASFRRRGEARGWGKLTYQRSHKFDAANGRVEAGEASHAAGAQ
jgi:hypothetical protein